MARNRQRAKDRKQKLHRENIPGSLDHASGEVEAAEAAIVAGAKGKPVEPDVAEPEPVDSVEPVEPVEPVDSVAVEPDPADPDAVAPDPVNPSARKRRSRKAEAVDTGAVEPAPVELEGEPDPADFEDDEVGDDRLGSGAGDVVAPPVARGSSIRRLFTFFRACWAELQRVEWPNRRQVGQATAVVLGFVVVAGAFLGLADVIAQQIVDFII